MKEDYKSYFYVSSFTILPETLIQVVDEIYYAYKLKYMHTLLAEPILL